MLAADLLINPHKNHADQHQEKDIQKTCGVFETQAGELVNQPDQDAVERPVVNSKSAIDPFVQKGPGNV